MGSDGFSMAQIGDARLQSSSGADSTNTNKPQQIKKKQFNLFSSTRKKQGTVSSFTRLIAIYSIHFPSLLLFIVIII
jgi:hypothetical protein